MVYRATRATLKNMAASDLRAGDVVVVGEYWINIRYESRDLSRHYDAPHMCSTVEKNGKVLDCTPGIERPYYIDNFLNR